MNATQLLYNAAGSPPMAGHQIGACRICGLIGNGLPFSAWVKDTFTDHDKLQSGEIICEACQFAFVESSAELARLVGKDKPQRMRNYSHFVNGGEWRPLSKGNKDVMRSLLLGSSFPELAIIADSGQKHIIFRARVNPPGGTRGYVQIEEQTAYIDRQELEVMLGLVERLYAGFSKSEIETGRYAQHRILKFGLIPWTALENVIKRRRGGDVLRLALFLAQREDDGGITATDGQATGDHLAGDPAGLQTEIPEHLATVRGQRPERGLHEQPGESHQLTLW
jgi:hypothetical protein